MALPDSANEGIPYDALLIWACCCGCAGCVSTFAGLYILLIPINDAVTITASLKLNIWLT